MDRREFRGLNAGFGDSLTRAVELVVTPLIFAWFGWLLDGAIGTRPLFAALFFGFVLAYLVWKMVAVYGRDMREHERRLLRPESEEPS